MTNPFLISAGLWAILAAFVLGLAIYRKSISRGEMDVVHIRDSDASMITGQATLANRMDKIDRWGKLLTIAVVVYGVAIVGLYLWSAWQASNNLGA